MPAVTFTRLLRLHRSHLDKLKRDNRGAAYRIDTTVTEIMSGFGGATGIPTTLGTSEQARFALGLYHQQAASRAAGKAAKAARGLSGSVFDSETASILTDDQE
jgi:CRISPR-associated protein Csd1